MNFKPSPNGPDILIGGSVRLDILGCLWYHSYKAIRDAATDTVAILCMPDMTHNYGGEWHQVRRSPAPDRSKAGTA